MLLEDFKSNFISVNLTTYNREVLLKRALRSILIQENVEFEIIIVDDCSSDNTKNIILDFQKKDPRIKFFTNEKNMGNAYSRNKALQQSRGEFIAFMDDDDEWIDTNKLEKQQKFLRKNPLIKLVFTNVIITDKKTYSKKVNCRIPKNIKKHFLGKNNLIYSPTVLTYRKILLEVKGFDEKVKKGVDSDLFRNLILRSNIKIACINEFTTKIYEDDRDRMTRVNSRKKIFNSLHSQLYTLKKYSLNFIKYPIEILRRFYYIFLLLLKLAFPKLEK